MASTTCFCFVLSSTTWPLFCSGFNKMAFVLFWHHPLRVLSVYTARDSRQVEWHQQHGFCFVLASTTKTTTRQGHISQVSITTRQGNEGTWGIVCNTSDSAEWHQIRSLLSTPTTQPLPTVNNAKPYCTRRISSFGESSSWVREPFKNVLADFAR